MPIPYGLYIQPGKFGYQYAGRTAEEVNCRVYFISAVTAPRFVATFGKIAGKYCIVANVGTKNERVIAIYDKDQNDFTAASVYQGLKR